MTTTPPEPQDNQPQQPGMISGATPWTSATPGQQVERPAFDAQGRPIEPPRSLATALLATAGASLVLTFVAVLGTDAQIDTLEASLAGETPTPSLISLISSLSFPLLIAVYVTYGLWSSRIRAHRVALGHTVTGPKAVEWWGWFVPIGVVFLIPWGARGISRGATSLGNILGWWLPYTAASLVSAYSYVVVLLSIDWVAAEITDPARLESSTTYAWIAAALTAVSYVFMVMFVRQTTARHLDV